MLHSCCRCGFLHSVSPVSLPPFSVHSVCFSNKQQTKRLWHWIVLACTTDSSSANSENSSTFPSQRRTLCGAGLVCPFFWCFGFVVPRFPPFDLDCLVSVYFPVSCCRPGLCDLYRPNGQNTQRVLIPLLVDSGHWCCADVSLLQHRVLIYDPFGAVDRSTIGGVRAFCVLSFPPPCFFLLL